MSLRGAPFPCHCEDFLLLSLRATEGSEAISYSAARKEILWEQMNVIVTPTLS